MSTSFKKTVSHGSIYALGDIIRNLTSIIMLPIYTSFLTPEDYGVIELLSMLLDFVSIVLGVRVGEAIFRFFCNAENENQKRRVISTALILVVVLNALGVLLVAAFSDQLSVIIFGGIEFSHFIALFTLVLVMQAVIELSLVYIRAIQKPWLFISVSVGRLMIQLTLNIYFVVVKDMHVEGVIYSAIIANFVICLLLLVYVIGRNGLGFSTQLAKEMTFFSFPLMLASIGSFYLTFGDRYFLRLYSGVSEVGIYSLGYKFGFMLLMVTWLPFERIWDTQRYEIYNSDNPDKNTTYAKFFIYISSLIMFVALGIALFVKDLLVIISDPAFHSAAMVVPLVLLAYILQAWTSFCGFGLLIKKKTKHFTYGAIVAVVIISAAYFTLIPLYASIGAAAATVIGFLARLLWIQYHSNKAYSMNLPWGTAIYLLGLAVTIYGLSLFAPEQLLFSILTKSALMLLFVLLYFISPILGNTEKKLLISLVKNPFNYKKILQQAN
jgi:O-antigen/teichoic acid export membrane protein